MRRGTQSAIQAIGPAVVAALNAAGKPPLGDGTNARAAVTANIEKSAHLIVSAAHKEDAFPANFPKEIVPCLRNLRRASGTNPAPKVEFFQFLLEYSGIHIVLLRQRRTGSTILGVLHGSPVIALEFSLNCASEEGARGIYACVSVLFRAKNYRARRSRARRARSNSSKRFSSARNSFECETRLQPERRVGCFTCSISWNKTYSTAHCGTLARSIRRLSRIWLGPGS